MNPTETDVIIVGTGPAGAFFLKRLLGDPAFGGKVLVLEKGARVPHQEQLRGGRKLLVAEAVGSFDNATPDKSWEFLSALGGSSNCWSGCVPRMLPNDFRLKSVYGVGADWPLSYAELEPYYCEAETILSVAGPSDESPFERSRPYPQPPHTLSDVDLALKAGNPGQFFVAPAARPSRPTRHRASCCGNGPCTLCPIDSKFTVLNELADLYTDPRVTLVTSATVRRLIRDGNALRGVEYEIAGEERRAHARVIVLGANAIFNPLILLESGLTHPEIGAGLVEQTSLQVRLKLVNLENFQGSTSYTGHGYMIYDGAHRSRQAGALLETKNAPPDISVEEGHWRHMATFKFIFEDLRQPFNRVTTGARRGRPVVTFKGESDYAGRGMQHLRENLTEILRGLPIREVLGIRKMNTESHILGTTPMAATPEQGPVDKWGRLFGHENVFVLGGSVFPTAAPANPTLTIAAHALFAADKAAEMLA